ncbi:MAG: hypothetical protein NTW49_14250, partial [Bacteroidia bacterium]|nr:hypothetical protein [Bacteroidia bacterium]
MKYFKILLPVILLIVIGFNAKSQKSSFPMGDWLLMISDDSTQHDMDVHVNLRHFIAADGKETVEVRNAEDRITTREIMYSGNKFSIFLPVHNTEIAGISMGDSVSGYIWPRGKSDINRKYKFRGYKNITDRFPEYKEHAAANVTGRWKITENAGTPDEDVMIGVFSQIADRVTGTVLTPSGDYRYLEGK